MNGYRVVSETGFFRVEDQLFHFEVDRGATITLAQGETRVLIRYEPRYPFFREADGLVALRPPF